MDFIDEKDGLLPCVLQAVGSLGDHAPYVGDTALHAAQSLKAGLRRRSNHVGKTRFAYAGWAIENDRGYSICLNRAPQELARTENMTLADNFVQRPGAHACGERRVRASRLLEFFRKEVLHG